MPDAIPTRLIVISSRVPEGDSCSGCEKLDRHMGSCELHGSFNTPIFEVESLDPYKRLPACRERDGWVAYPADSGVPELVETARAYAAASAAANEAKEEHGMGSSKVVPFINANTTARWALQDAARKVAGEAER